jgi:serine protease Do
MIATNFHVVEAARKLTVRLWDGREYPAQLAGGDKETDIALIRVQSTPPLTPAVLGDSDRLRAGDWVMAMGNPFNYTHSVTVGVVSARQRLIDGLPFEQFIQTDAAINFGNSGGPLLNMKGQVVGMAAAISTRGRSIGFAIPINLAKAIFQQLSQQGRVIRGYLGIRPVGLTEELCVLLKASSKSGVVVEDVSSGSGAALAGIQRYDIISGIDGKPIQDRQDFFTQVSNLQPGRQAQLEVWRDGKSYSAQVLIQERLAIQAGRGENEGVSPESENRGLGQQPWGISAQDLPERYRSDAKITGPDRRGVFVDSILPLSPAAEVDLLPGDVILELNRHPLNSLRDYQAGIFKTLRDRSVVLLILRPPNVTRLLVLKKLE